LVSFDGNRQGLDCQCSLHLGGVVGSDVSVASGKDGGVGLRRVSAGSIGGSVLPVCFFHSVARLVVIEGLVLPASITAVALCSAADELLLSETEKRSVLDLPGTFHGTSSRESPAGTALSLVLDSVDGSCCFPVDRVGDGVFREGHVVLVGLGHGFVGKKGFVFPLTPVGHLVVGKLEGGADQCVVLIDFFICSSEVR